jgi:hypothetical protein
MNESIHKPKSLGSSIAAEERPSDPFAPYSTDEILIRKLKSLESAIASEKGPFDLFALFSTDDELEDKWDLVVAATWIDEDDRKALDYLSSKLQKDLTPEEFLSISKIAILDVYDPRDIQKHYQIEHDLRRLTEYKFYGIRVDIVYLITSKIQVDAPLLRAMWQIIVKMWRSGNKAISSEDILIRLEEQGQSVPNYAMDRIFDYLMSSKCISGPQFADRDGIKQHGAMLITFVDRECSVPELPE